MSRCWVHIDGEGSAVQLLCTIAALGSVSLWLQHYKHYQPLASNHGCLLFTNEFACGKHSAVNALVGAVLLFCC
jgi:hypothetical protein